MLSRLLPPFVILMLVFVGSIDGQSEPGAVCLEGSVRYGGDESWCYNYDRRPLTFEEAAESARLLGGQLASVQNAFESAAVHQAANNGIHYLGALCDDSDVCHWIDGAVFNYTSRFATGNPNHLIGSCIYANSLNEWRSVSCDTLLPSVALVKMPRPLFDSNYSRETAWPSATLPLKADGDIRSCLQSRNYSGNTALVQEVGCDPFWPNSTLITCLFVAVRGIPGSSRDKDVLFLFRSTSSFLEGIWEDFTYQLVPFEIIETGEVIGEIELFFYNAFNVMWKAGLKEFVMDLKASENIEILNYSLGTGIGFAFSAYCEALLGNFAEKTKAMYFFGTPRPSDVQLRKFHESRFRNFYMVTHRADIVARVPVPDENNTYSHRGPEIFFANSMEKGADFTVCSNGENHHCSIGYDEPDLDIAFADHSNYYQASDPQFVPCFLD